MTESEKKECQVDRPAPSCRLDKGSWCSPASKPQTAVPAGAGCRIDLLGRRLVGLSCLMSWASWLVVKRDVSIRCGWTQLERDTHRIERSRGACVLF